MSHPNVIGYVTEFIEEPSKVLLKLKLKNTVGEMREILVEGPADLGDFFSAERSREDMAKVLVGE